MVLDGLNILGGRDGLRTKDRPTLNPLGDTHWSQSRGNQRPSPLGQFDNRLLGLNRRLTLPNALAGLDQALNTAGKRAVLLLKRRYRLLECSLIA